MPAAPHRKVALLAAGVLVTSFAVTSAAAEATSPTCFGKKATITASKKNAKVKGTSKADVIIVTGKNATITGGKGNDKICAPTVKSVDGGAGDDKIQITAGTAKGGAGNDTLVQKAGKSGKVTLQGGSGTDSLSTSTNASAGSRVDGGTDVDAFSVPGSLLKVSITHDGGDSLNGFTIDAAQPGSGAPKFALAVDGRIASGTPIPMASTSAATTFDPNQGDEIDFVGVTFAAGRAPASWRLDFGDGSSLSGLGFPPSEVDHQFLGTGTRTITGTVTDSLGVASASTMAVVLDPNDLAAVTLTAGAPGPDGTTAFTSATAASSPTRPRAAVTSWLLDYGDGTQTAGPGAVPADLGSHVYGPGSYSARLAYAFQQEGESETQVSSQPVTVTGPSPAAPHLSYNVSGYDSRGTYGAAALIVQPGNYIRVDAETSTGFDSIEIDGGNGAAPVRDSFGYVAYDKPGTFTLTIRGKRAGQPDLTTTRTVSVQTPPASITVAGPSTVNEGDVASYAVGGSLPAGAIATERTSAMPGYARITSLPKTVSVVASTRQGASVRFDASAPDLPLTDTTSLRWSVSGSRGADVTPLATSASLYLDEEEYGYRGGELQQPISPYEYSSSPRGVKASTGTVNYGDGTLKTAPGAAFNSSPDAFLHQFVGDADRIVSFTVTDTKGHKAIAYSSVSTAGRLTITPETRTDTSATATYTLTGVTPTFGANSKPFAYSVGWDDTDVNNPGVSGFGSLPASLTHTYASSGPHSVSVTVYDDHGQSATANITVTTP